MIVAEKCLASLLQRDFGFPMPPCDEQVAIVSHLDGQIRSTGRIGDMIEDQIEKPGEYRQRLISAAVTGKIDVRGGMGEWQTEN